MFPILLLVSVATIQARHLNLTYGRLKFANADEIVTFKTLEEYNLFLESNNMQSDTNEPGYLVKCIEANKNKFAACLDGSPQAFYYRPGYGNGVNKFVLYLQGGGWCSGIDYAVASSCGQSCYDRAMTSDRGTSATDEPYIYISNGQSGDGYMSDQYGVNPLAYNWNTVYVRYCDGASFSGYNSTVRKAKDGSPIYFTGFNNLNAVLDKLKNEYNLLNATDVILTGSSAGGLAVWLHTDYIAKYVGVGKRKVNFLSIPDSGFFIDYGSPGNYDTCMQWLFDNQNTSIALNQKCMDNNDDDYKCMFAQYTAPYIENKMMVLQSRFDTWQTGAELRSNNATLINEYGNNLTRVIMDTFVNTDVNKNRLLFLDSCAHHTDQWNRIIIDGFNSSQAEVNFWFGNGTKTNVYFQNMTYPCDSCCTPN
eukprot:309757_1